MSFHWRRTQIPAGVPSNVGPQSASSQPGRRPRCSATARAASVADMTRQSPTCGSLTVLSIRHEARRWSTLHTSQLTSPWMSGSEPTMSQMQQLTRRMPCAQLSEGRSRSSVRGLLTRLRGCGPNRSDAIPDTTAISFTSHQITGHRMIHHTKVRGRCESRR